MAIMLERTGTVMGKRFDVVSLDMFQTLVNIDTRIRHIWQPILGDRYTEEEAYRHAAEKLQIFFRDWEQTRDGPEFVSLYEVNRRGFMEHFERHGLAFDNTEALEILFREHRMSELYSETDDFLRKLTRGYNVCIVSDTDDAMLTDFYQAYPVKLFSSEVYRSYKNDRENAMFRDMIRFYGADPSRIIHVGDSASDVLGAKREGIVSCWLNRNGVPWKHKQKPDHTITDLNGLWSILGDGREEGETR